MSLMAKIFGVLGVFVVVDLAVYWWHSYENEGSLLLLAVALGALLFGGYLYRDVRRSKAASREAGVGELEAEEPHVGPTIWPVLLAVAMVGLVVGALGATWALVEGTLLLVVALVGWALDVRRQWQHHHGEPEGLEDVR
jgi:Cytochrome c oxidase subunit IV